jgi:outer membrane protein OmpA-like peptidoglycan-associated protein
MTLYFFYDSIVHRPESNNSLQVLTGILRRLPTVHVQLTGHASLEGTSDYNLQLSRRRVEAVRETLRLDGIVNSRIHTFAAGEAIPAVPEPNVAEISTELEDIRNRNRRVEVVFYDPTGTFAPRAPQLQLRTPSPRLPEFGRNQ